MNPYTENVSESISQLSEELANIYIFLSAGVIIQIGREKIEKILSTLTLVITMVISAAIRTTNFRIETD